jgi:hypothetical protein
MLLSLNEEHVIVSPACKAILYPMGEALGVVQDGVLIGESWASLSEIIKP